MVLSSTDNAQFSQSHQIIPTNPVPLITIQQRFEENIPNPFIPKENSRLQSREYIACHKQFIPTIPPIMKFHRDQIQIRTTGKGLTDITEGIQAFLRDRQIAVGMCHLFIQHTSASLVVNESFDPSAREDMETFMEKTIPEYQSWMTHTLEGGDDSPSHLRTMLTNISLSIPIDNGHLALGTWQGIYLFEHRRQPHTRKILIRCMEFEEGEIV